MNKNEKFNDLEFNISKNELYQRAYNNKIFRARVIKIRRRKIYFNESIYYDIFFTKSKNENYCCLNPENKNYRFYISSILI